MSLSRADLLLQQFLTIGTDFVPEGNLLYKGSLLSGLQPSNNLDSHPSRYGLCYQSKHKSIFPTNDFYRDYPKWNCLCNICMVWSDWFSVYFVSHFWICVLLKNQEYFPYKQIEANYLNIMWNIKDTPHWEKKWSHNSSLGEPFWKMVPFWKGELFRLPFLSQCILCILAIILPQPR